MWGGERDNQSIRDGIDPLSSISIGYDDVLVTLFVSLSQPVHISIS